MEEVSLERTQWESANGARSLAASLDQAALTEREVVPLLGSALELAVLTGLVQWSACLLPTEGRTWRVAAAAGPHAPAPGTLIPGVQLASAGRILFSDTPSISTAADCTPLGHTDLGEPLAWFCSNESERSNADTAASLAALTGHLESLVRSWDAVRRLSSTDPLVGVFTQTAVEQRLTVEIARAERYGGGLSVLLCDLEGLTAIRDARGRRAADTVMRVVVDSLRSHVRQADVVGRYGGDTFLVVLPETRADESLQAGSRLALHASRAVQGAITVDSTTRIEAQPMAPPRMRIGASTYPAPARSAEELLDQAAAALRAARATGGAEWLRHWLDSLNQPLSSGYSCVCRHCGRIFETKDRAQQRARRFCSHECYIEARRAEEAKRNDAIIELRQHGLSMREIGRRFHLSAERVRQICLRMV